MLSNSFEAFGCRCLCVWFILRFSRPGGREGLKCVYYIAESLIEKQFARRIKDCYNI